jgi:hypothetical protein
MKDEPIGVRFAKRSKSAFRRDEQYFPFTTFYEFGTFTLHALQFCFEDRRMRAALLELLALSR